MSLRSEIDSSKSYFSSFIFAVGT